jgi:cobalt-zinc-cadmium efflux system membrane fusion protein
MRCRTSAALILAGLALTASCSRPPAEGQASGRGKTEATPHQPARAAKEQEHADESEAHEALPSKVRVAPKVIQAAGIKTAAALVETLPATVDLTGEVAADPDRSARVAARLSARIVEVRVREGDRVKAGQVLAVLESSELARARAALTTATARARSARFNAQRLGNLEAKALASGQEAMSANAEAEALEAEVAAARQTIAAFGPGAQQAQGAVARMSLRSPLSGFVLARDGVPGQTLDAEHVIVVVGDLENAYFLGRIFEKDLERVKVGAFVETRLNAYPHEVFAGTVEAIGKQLDASARTVLARIRVKNHADLLKVGLFGSARVVTRGPGSQRPRVVVPLSAVTRVADRDVVFVRQPDDDFELHPVTLGRTAAGRVEVLSGLREGERVVVDGVFSLKSAVLRSTFGEEE